MSRYKKTLSLQPGGCVACCLALRMPRSRAELTVMGADISSLKKSEDKGGVYAYEDGAHAEALQILRDHGLNYARIRCG